MSLSKQSGNALSDGDDNTAAENQNFVQLVFNEPKSLGLEIFRHRNGVVHVTRVSPDGQAENVCIDILLEPEVLDDAVIVAINGVPYDPRDTGIQLYNELKSKARPKHILFALRMTNTPDVKHAFCVNKIRNGKFIELVFWKRVMGVRVDQKQDEKVLKVDHLEGKSEAAKIAEQCLLDPAIFIGASIIGVNGRKYKNKTAMFTALTTPNRPKFILFELSHSPKSSPLYNVTAMAKPPVPNLSPQQKQQKEETTPEKQQQSREDSMNFDDIKSNGSGESNHHNHSPSTPPRSFSRSPPSRSNQSKSPRRLSTAMLEKAVYASKSMRQLAAPVGHDDDDDDDNDNSPSSPTPQSPPRRNYPDQAQLVADSKRKLEICLDEMEKLNLQIDEEAENQRKFQESMARMEKLNAENERSISVVSVGEQNNNNDSTGDGEDMMSPKSSKARYILQGFQNFTVRERIRQRWNSSNLNSQDDLGGSSNVGDGSMYLEEEEAAEHERLKQEAYEACIKAIREHLEAFLAETPDVSYEEWIEELHPENAKSRRNLVKGRSIDHRFYVENSDHRKLWNAHLDEDGLRQYVPIRDYVPAGDRYNDNTTGATPVKTKSQQTKKSLSFKRTSSAPNKRASIVKFSDEQEQLQQVQLQQQEQH